MKQFEQLRILLVGPVPPPAGGMASSSISTTMGLVRDAPAWYSDNVQYHNKVLLLWPKAQSSTPDVYLYVPAAAQLQQDPPPRPLVFQIQIKGSAHQTDPKRHKPTLLNVAKEAAKALHIPQADSVFVFLADKLLSPSIKPGLYSSPERGHHAYFFVAKDGDLEGFAPRRAEDVASYGPQ